MNQNRADLFWPLHRAQFLLPFLILFLFPKAIWAALGERLTTDQVLKSESSKALSHRQKTLPSGKTLSWKVREYQMNGNTIREHISPDGLVFAVSWRGIKRPDLSKLLGDYYDEFATSENSQGRIKGKRSATIVSDKLVAHRSGHMRDLRGEVYLKNSLPEGITAEDLQ